jgi:hypothetical protein
VKSKAFRQTPAQLHGVSDDESEAISGRAIDTPSVSSVSAAVINRDKSCVTSKNRDCVERAHLCPRNELDWFRKNGMRWYNARLDTSGDVITGDIANALAMRSDIHRAFGERNFALARKSGRWTINEIVKTLDLAGFEKITATSRGRSTSPKKRKAAGTLPPVAEVKRFCKSSHFKPDEMPTSTDYQSDEERTPDLYSDGGNSV